jgi:uncharacterized protein (TIGR03083 family)
VHHPERIEAVAREAAALVAAVAAGDPAAVVPTCPDYTLDDLAAHVGEFCAFYADVLSEGGGRPKRAFDPDPVSESRAGWLAAVAHHLVDELRASPPELEVWTWHPTDHSAAFVARRCANELAVHRVDAQLGAGLPPDPVDPALAADGIEEVFVLMAHAAARTGDRSRDGDRRGQTLRLHGTDHDPAQWLVTFAPEGVRVARSRARGDLALRGTVSDLEMVLYQRPPIGRVERSGDDAVLDLFHREFTFA